MPALAGFPILIGIKDIGYVFSFIELTTEGSDYVDLRANLVDAGAIPHRLTRQNQLS
jgi:hypothetical protein